MDGDDATFPEPKMPDLLPTVGGGEMAFSGEAAAVGSSDKPELDGSESG